MFVRHLCSRPARCWRLITITHAGASDPSYLSIYVIYTADTVIGPSNGSFQLKDDHNCVVWERCEVPYRSCRLELLHFGTH